MLSQQCGQSLTHGIHSQADFRLLRGPDRSRLLKCIRRDFDRPAMRRHFGPQLLHFRGDCRGEEEDGVHGRTRQRTLLFSRESQPMAACESIGVTCLIGEYRRSSPNNGDSGEDLPRSQSLMIA